MNPNRVDFVIDLAYGLLIFLSIVLILVVGTGIGVAFGLGALVSYIIHVGWKMARFDPEWMTKEVTENIEATLTDEVAGNVEENIAEEVAENVEENIAEEVAENVEENIAEEVTENVEETLTGEIDAVIDRLEEVNERIDEDSDDEETVGTAEKGSEDATADGTAR